MNWLRGELRRAIQQATLGKHTNDLIAAKKELGLQVSILSIKIRVRERQKA